MRRRPRLHGTLLALAAAAGLLAPASTPEPLAVALAANPAAPTANLAARNAPWAQIPAASAFGADDLDPADLPDLTARPHPKLDTVLDEVVRTLRQRGLAAAMATARQRHLELQGDRLLVRIDTGFLRLGTRLEQASSRSLVEGVADELRRLDAQVRNVWGPYVEARVPLDAIDDLLLRSDVRGVRRVWRAVPAATSEGVSVIGADRWESAVFRRPDDPTVVGIIDTGFQDFRMLQPDDLPPDDRITTRSFRDDGIEGDSGHGAATAEIVFDVAPDIDFVFASIETSGDLSSAIDFMLDQGVDVIGMSLGFFNAGPGDGSGPVVDIVERAPQQGVPFITSTGNQADRHWLGRHRDQDGDQLLEFADGDETNSFNASAGDRAEIFMTWDVGDWSSSEQDFDLLLFDNTGTLIDQSRDRQGGLPGQFATESIDVELPADGLYHIVIQRVQAPRAEILELHTLFSGLEHVVAAQSLTVPADGREVIAVGSTFWGSDVVEPFSSRGPTKDGRIKPDFAAPDGVSTETFGPGGFFGTSAAAPHVIGAVALIRARLGLVSPAQALRILEARALDLGPPGEDNSSGVGRLSLVPS